jgi:NAD+ kinase
MKIAIYARSTPDNASKYVANLFTKLDELKAEVMIFQPYYDFLKENKVLKKDYKTFSSNKEMREETDYLISIGGDGTLLETIYLVRNSGIPILGINTGRLGFLASVSKEEIDDALIALSEKRFTLDKRAMLRLETPGNLFGDVNYALNEITIMKKDSNMVTIHAYINGEFLNSYWADGLIISTPTGSTAYSLSCGGPIVLPESENIIITPIAAHNLNVCPLVVSDRNEITLKIEGRSPNYLLSLDSRSEVIDSTVELSIKKEGFSINLVRLKQQNFFNTIRHKLMWGIDRRN